MANSVLFSFCIKPVLSSSFVGLSFTKSTHTHTERERLTRHRSNERHDQLTSNRTVRQFSMSSLWTAKLEFWYLQSHGADSNAIKRVRVVWVCVCIGLLCQIKFYFAVMWSSLTSAITIFMETPMIFQNVFTLSLFCFVLFGSCCCGCGCWERSKCIKHVQLAFHIVVYRINFTSSSVTVRKYVSRSDWIVFVWALAVFVTDFIFTFLLCFERLKLARVPRLTNQIDRQHNIASHR